MTRPAFFDGKHVSDKGGRQNDEAGFANADQGVTNQQSIKVRGNGGEQSRPAPHHGPGDDDPLCAKSAAKAAP